MDVSAIYDKSLVIDAHCDYLYQAVHNQRQLAKSDLKYHLDLPRMQKGGLSAQIFAVFDEWAELKEGRHPTIEALRQIDIFYNELDTNARTLRLVRRADDLKTLKQEGKIGCMLGIEGADVLKGELALLRLFHRLGVRNLTLTWNYNNEVGDCSKTPDGGLTDFGRLVIKEMNRLGMLIDIAHLSDQAAEQVLKLSGRPIIDSHANARSLCPHWRNLSDRLLDLLAENGGLVCVTFVPLFISSKKEEASLEKLLDHIDYITRRIGVEHVGLGSDFEGYDSSVDGITRGLEDVACLPNIAHGLASRGYSAEQIQQILGGNFLRLFSEAVGD
jgi:membrane dipeptidase